MKYTSDEELAAFDKQALEELTKSNSITNWTKEKAMNHLWHAEIVYLGARGWTLLAGIPNKYLVPPGEKMASDHSNLFSLKDALARQKEIDEYDLNWG
jgi:hypothetical protein